MAILNNRRTGMTILEKSGRELSITVEDPALSTGKAKQHNPD